jgi:AAHS family 4-hydroxybenzoate transporter-like MFS transporter
MSSAPTPIGVTALIDGIPISRLQYQVFALAALSVFLDGYDTQAVAYIAPIVSRSWHLPTGSFGPVFAAGLIGSALGSLVLAPLSDRVGRKRVLVACAAAIGLLTLLCATARSLGMLEGLRFLAGLGLGAALPNALALIAEYAPERRRTTIVSSTFCGLAVGAALGAVAATALVPRWGWRAVFVAGGVGTLLLWPTLQWRLPESLSYLALRRPGDRETVAVLSRLMGARQASSITLVAERQEGRRSSHLALLFNEGRRLVTVTYGLLAFLTLLTLYLLNNWLPTLIHSRGLSVDAAAWSTAAFQIGGIAGTIILGVIADRFDPIRVVVVSYVAAAVALVSIAGVLEPGWVALAAFAAGFSVIGAQSCNNAMLTGLYPTASRGAALGWNLAFGRIGSILGPTITGILLLMSIGAERVLVLAAVPVVCAAVLLVSAAGAIRRVVARAKAARL